MLLLDHNLPHQLRELLTGYGVQSESTRYRGWETLRNGDLVSVATQAGFKAIVTRDRKFAESAAKALSKFPGMAVVIVRLDQRSWVNYREAFRKAWEASPIIPVAGKMARFPCILEWRTSALTRCLEMRARVQRRQVVGSTSPSWNLGFLGHLFSRQRKVVKTNAATTLTRNNTRCCHRVLCLCTESLFVFGDA